MLFGVILWREGAGLEAQMGRQTQSQEPTDDVAIWPISARRWRAAPRFKADRVGHPDDALTLQSNMPSHAQHVESDCLNAFAHPVAPSAELAPVSCTQTVHSTLPHERRGRSPSMQTARLGSNDMPVSEEFVSTCLGRACQVLFMAHFFWRECSTDRMEIYAVKHELVTALQCLRQQRDGSRNSDLMALGSPLDVSRC